MVTNHRDSEGLTQDLPNEKAVFLGRSLFNCGLGRGLLLSFELEWVVFGSDVELVITLDTFDCLASITANFSGHKLHATLVWCFKTGSLIAQASLKL